MQQTAAMLAPDETLAADLAAAADRVIRSGSYIAGPELEAFEHEFAAYCGSRHCVGVGNGFDALYLTLRAYGIGPGDEVIVPSNTYIATWLAVSHTGARPVPVEPDVATFTIDTGRVEASISPRTRAIIAVHLYGLPADMTVIRALAGTYNLIVIEDAAQAHGAAIGTCRAGSLGDAAAFSFYPTKNLGAFGDGGAVTTDDDHVASTVRTLRNYGSERRNDHAIKGVNSRLDELQAALLRIKLARLDDWNRRRSEIASRYAAWLASSDVVLPVAPEGMTHAWHQYVIRHERRDALQRHLANRGVGTLIHYPEPPHRSGAYAGDGVPEQPLAERLAHTVLSLPVLPAMTDDHCARVCDAVRSFVPSG